MTRKLVVAALAVFLFAGCQSAQTFGQSPSAAPAAKSGGVLEWVKGVVSPVLGTSSDPAPAAAPGAATPGAATPGVAETVAPKAVSAAPQAVSVTPPPGPTNADLARALSALEPILARADRRAGQARDVGWAGLGIAVVTLILVALIAVGVLRPFASASLAEREILRGLSNVKKRQATLAATLAQLEEYAVRFEEEREQVATLLKGASEEMKRLDAATAALGGREQS